MFTFDRNPPAPLDKATKMMVCVLLHCCRYGLIPNTAKGKSALLLALRGKGAKAAAAAASADNCATVAVTTPGSKCFNVKVEASYLHLGGMISRDADTVHEARRRTAVARASYNAASKQLLQNKHIELSIRSMLFGSLVASTFHNLELWTPNDKSWKQLQRGSDSLNKRFLACERMDLSTTSLLQLKHCK